MLDSVRKALEQGDVEAHKKMSSKGGINASLLNADRKNQQEKDLDAFLARQQEIYQMNDEGDILPPDPKEPDTFKH